MAILRAAPIVWGSETEIFDAGTFFRVMCSSMVGSNLVSETSLSSCRAVSIE